MKRLLLYLLYACAALVVIAVAALGWLRFAGLPHYPVQRVELSVERTPERVAHGRRLARLMCVGCHRNPETGTLSGHPIADLPGIFGHFYSANITRDPVNGIGGWSDGELAHLFRTGIRRDGRLAVVMPSFPRLSDEDMLSLIAFLRSNDPLVRPTAVPTTPPDPSPFGTALARFVFKPHAMPTRPILPPSEDDAVAYGRYLALARLDCYSCHSADFASNDGEHPERSAGFFGGGNKLLDANGEAIYSANITPDPETGIGRWSEADFVRALKVGLRPDNRPLRYPMTPQPDLTDQEASALYKYLRTVPALRHARRAGAQDARFAERGAASGVSGRVVFDRYCAACHGPDGRKVYDVTRSSQDFPTQEQLKAWIRRASSIRPDTKMPTWEGILRDEEIEAVALYVRELAGRGSR